MEQYHSAEKRMQIVGVRRLEFQPWLCHKLWGRHSIFGLQFSKLSIKANNWGNLYKYLPYKTVFSHDIIDVKIQEKLLVVICIIKYCILSWLNVCTVYVQINKITCMYFSGRRRSSFFFFFFKHTIKQALILIRIVFVTNNLYGSTCPNCSTHWLQSYQQE